MKTSVAVFAILLVMVTSIAIFWALQLGLELISEQAVRHEQERKQKIDLATKELQELEFAATIYDLSYGYYPDSLALLAKSKRDGGKELIIESLLTDPWGRLYRYERDKRHPQSNKPLIYTQGPDPADPKAKITNWDVFDKKK